MKRIITLFALISAFTLNFAFNPHDDLPELKRQASEVSGAEAQKISNQTTDEPSLSQSSFSINGSPLKSVLGLLRLSRSFSIYREAQDPLTDLFIIESDENGVSLSVRNEVEKADFNHACFNEETSPVVGEREVTISGTIIKDTFICSNSFKFAEGAVVANARSMMALIFLNPESLISSIILEFDSEKSFESCPLNLGLICGCASFLENEKSKLEFRGFKKITVIFNLETLKKIKR